MKLYAPDYYTRFKCIAGDCRRSCCAEGWDIEIDPGTLEFYGSVGGEIGEMLKNGIDYSGQPRFKTDSDGKCVFFRSDGLCGIITELGENALCQICADHPRFRNFYGSRTETGIGLCCEEACRIVLSNEKKTEILPVAEDGTESAADETEERFFILRDEIFGFLQDRDFPVRERFARLFDAFGIEYKRLSSELFAREFLKTEIMSPDWVRLLEGLKERAPKTYVPPELETAFEQLAVYFVYRHLAGGLYDGRLTARLRLAAAAADIIREMLLRADTADFRTLAEISRLFSSEIEYSEENIGLLTELCGG